MKFHCLVQLFALVIFIVLPSLDAEPIAGGSTAKKKTKFTPIDLSQFPDASTSQIRTTARPPSQAPSTSRSRPAWGQQSAVSTNSASHSSGRSGGQKSHGSSKSPDSSSTSGGNREHSQASPSHQGGQKNSPSTSSSSSSVHSSGRGTGASGGSLTRGMKGLSLTTSTSTPLPENTDNIITEKSCAESRLDEAEKCFDHLILAVFWPPAMRHAYTKKEKTVRNHLASKDRWSIHGLWPSVKNGNVPESCTHTDLKAKYRIHHLQQSNIWSRLQTFWFNIVDYGKDNRAHGMTYFWTHEFDKHGACASRLKSMKTDVDYFTVGLDLLRNANPAAKLQLIGLVPGGSMKYSTFVNNFVSAMGKKIKLEYVTVRQETTKKYYLKEVYICYDLELKHIDCPSYTSPPDDRDESLIYHMAPAPRSTA